MTTGDRIKAARKAAGLTQKELAEKLQVAYQTIQQYESSRRNPKLQTIRKIAAAIGVPDRELMGDYEFDDPALPQMKEIFSAENWSRWVDEDQKPLFHSREEFEEWTKNIDPSDPPLLDGYYISDDPSIKKEPASGEDGLDELISMYRQLTPDNRAKLLELCRLYLNAQDKKE